MPPSCSTTSAARPGSAGTSSSATGLIANQVRGDGCDRGSWDPRTAPARPLGTIQAGRHYSTCLSLLTLEVYYRYLPLYQRRDLNPLDSADDNAAAAE